MENKLFEKRSIEWWLDPRNEWFVQYENRVAERMLEVLSHNGKDMQYLQDK